MSLFLEWSPLFPAVLGMESRALEYRRCPSTPFSLYAQLGILLGGGAGTVFMLAGVFSFCGNRHCTQALVSPTLRWLVPWGHPTPAEVETSSLAQTNPWVSDPQHTGDCMVSTSV